ncbi:hypothetical protein [Hyphococcus luteus]|uniref:Uncharacterized protein n=1 Tax=Hyphococcus luteus TaxID=2058213 RepID=A0A2S7K5Y4_9PROT|nr:hypothetical protein [Marinicaulis flavus]PQA87920.1 hypothetical protein CW354_06130 [Marinicaulis flavus]
MKIKQALAGIAAAAAFGAAAIASDFGAAPADYEAQAIDYFDQRLTEPRSARYEFAGEPYQVFADVSGYEGLPCWAVDVRVKARMPNGRMGGYVPYTVLFLDGEPIALEADTMRMVRA